MNGNHSSEPINFVSKKARVDPSAKIWHFTYVGDRSSIGAETKIGSLVHIDYNVKIGENCKIEGLAYLPPKTRIGNNVFIGPSVVITNDKYPPSDRWQGVKIRDGAIIGAGSCLLAGITIGQEAVIGMGSVVTKSIPKQTVWHGNPARHRGFACDCLYKMHEHDHPKQKLEKADMIRIEE